MNSRRRIVVSIWLFVFVLLVGVAGFKTLGGPEWSLLDAAYMTVITVATIGYGEVHDLAANPAARIFAAAYIILSLGTIAFAVTSITAFVVEGELKRMLGRRKMDKEIGRLAGHDIVCGSDETAQTIVGELRSTKRDFVVVDPSAEKLEKIAAAGGAPYVVGDPADDETLVRAGIERARGLLLSLPTDEANLFVTISARGLNPRLRIVAKGIDVRAHSKLKKAGADYVVSPTFIGGMRMVSEMVRPAAVSFLDTMLRDRGANLRVEDVLVPPGSAFAGRTVGASGLRERAECLLVAIKRGGRENDYVFNPAAGVVLEAGDALVFIAPAEAAAEVRRLAAGPGKPA